MRRFFREQEEDKISNEIINEIYPTIALNKYYKFGYANALSHLTDMANKYINGKYADKLDAFDLKTLIQEISFSDKEVKEYFERLRKDGIKLDTEKEFE